MAVRITNARRTKKTSFSLSEVNIIAGLMLLGLTFYSMQYGRGVQSKFSLRPDERQQRIQDHGSSSSVSVDEASAVTVVLKKEARKQEDNVAYYKGRYNYHPPATSTTRQGENELCGAAPDYTHFFSSNGGVQRSRLSEDKTIYEIFFKGRHEAKGTYIELGAYNGIQESNSRFFDMCLGWEGLLVEGNPDPQVWGKLVENRPTAHRMNYIPCCNAIEQAANTTITFHTVPMTNAGVEAQDRGVNNAYNGHGRVAEVPCGSLSQVLVDLFPPDGKISFFSLDVEGSEHLVLEKIEFDKVFIEMLMVEVENNHCGPKGCESSTKSREILKNAGYFRFSNRISKSDVFVHKRSKDLLELAQRAGWTATEGPSEGAIAVPTDHMNYYKQRYNYHPRDVNGDFDRAAICGQGPDYDEFFALKLQEHSRLGEDKTMYDTFFKTMNQTKGTYIEIGAYNGKQESNTRFFDICLGWEGLLVEGNPRASVWGGLVQNRPTAHRMNYVPCCNATEQAAGKTTTFYPFHFTNAGIEAPDRGVKTAYDGSDRTVEVPCGSLSQVLVDLFPPDGRISFFSLDVEGSEHLVLEKIEFDKVYIEMLMVEVINNFCKGEVGCEARSRSREILKSARYFRFSNRISKSDVFIHERSKELLDLARKAGWAVTEAPGINI
jgi:hypothetical protein